MRCIQTTLVQISSQTSFKFHLRHLAIFFKTTLLFIKIINSSTGVEGSLIIGNNAESSTTKEPLNLYLYANNAPSSYGVRDGGDINILAGSNSGGTGRNGYIKLAETHGKRFLPADMLKEMARKGKRFYG